MWKENTHNRISTAYTEFIAWFKRRQTTIFSIEPFCARKSHNLFFSILLFHFLFRYIIVFASRMHTFRHARCGTKTVSHNYCRVIEVTFHCRFVSYFVCSSLQVNSFTQNVKLNRLTYIQDFAQRFFFFENWISLCIHNGFTALNMKYVQLEKWHNCNGAHIAQCNRLVNVCQCNCKMRSEDTLASSISKINRAQLHAVQF